MEHVRNVIFMNKALERIVNSLHVILYVRLWIEMESVFSVKTSCYLVRIKENAFSLIVMVMTSIR